ncbi:MAG: zinc ribbon domain-containing protein [Candidatus Sumerlaeales bacterium]|nr:zinc ribbon domain-containing protein [Candidatus Sumerlaeales bacterium]
MPTYEYFCKKCGKKFEYFQHINEPQLTTCEDCGGDLERLVGAGSGLIFKGSGFYITDYAHAHTDVAASSSSEHESSHTSEASASSGSAKDTSASSASVAPKASVETKLSSPESK